MAPVYTRLPSSSSSSTSSPSSSIARQCRPYARYLIGAMCVVAVMHAPAVYQHVNDGTSAKDRRAEATCKINCGRHQAIKCDLLPRTSAAVDLMSQHGNLVNYNLQMTPADQQAFKANLYTPKYAEIFGRGETPDEIQRRTQLGSREEYMKETSVHGWYVQTEARYWRNDSGVANVARTAQYFSMWRNISAAIKKFDERPPGDNRATFFNFFRPPYTYGSDHGLGGMLMKYQTFMKESRGTVIGSEKPWIEAHLIKAGVKQVVTSEYTNFSAAFTQPDRLKYTHPDELKALAPFDFAVSYSSVEHSGLGRYGDPYNIVGDLVEMARLSCVVRPGGLVFIGFPTGTDHQYGNWHRFYGPKRLSLLFDCWMLIDVLGAPRLEVETGGDGARQPWFVLQNVVGCTA